MRERSGSAFRDRYSIFRLTNDPFIPEQQRKSSRESRYRTQFENPVNKSLPARSRRPKARQREGVGWSKMLKLAKAYRICEAWDVRRSMMVRSAKEYR